MRGWWSRRSKRAKARLVFYPSILLSAAGFVAFCTVMPGRTYRGALPPLGPEGAELATRLRTDVSALVGERGDRSQYTKGSLARAAAIIDTAFHEAGYAVARLPYDSDGVTVENLEATRAGGAKAREIVIVGAHYDTAARGPGADDNASGVAAMLAIARAFATRSPSRTVRFVAFANEEPPHFWNPTMGSLVYAKACRAHGDDVVAMLSLETLGYYRDERGTQKYPPIVSALYPDRGDFVAFVGNLSSRSLVRRSIGLFREAAAFPSEGAAFPSFVAGVGWSDHWSFWEAGYPAVMVTDTAPFRNPGYHQPFDLPDTLDYPRLARVTAGLVSVVEHLAE